LPDGVRLLVGGHLSDGDGVNRAALYDGATNTWTATALMNEGRWYPTATTLPDGSVLVLSGSLHAASGETVVDDLLQIWRNGAWSPIINAVGEQRNLLGLPLYPRMHVMSDGEVVMAGPPAESTLPNTAAARGRAPLGLPAGTR